MTDRTATFDDERFDELLSKLVDARLEPREERELAALLRDNPPARAAYVEYVSLHGWLAWDAPETPGSTAGKPPTVAPLPVDSPAPPGGVWGTFSDFVSRSIAFFAEPTPLSMSVATVVVAVVVGALAIIPLRTFLAAPEPGGDVAERDEPGVLPRGVGPVVAHVGRALAPEWTNDSHAFLSGDELREGDSLHLAGGSVEIVFDSGARATVRGPAQFSVVAPDRGRLYSGQLAARVEPAAAGFVVDTQAVAVKDLGTEFTVYVDRTLATVVRVYEGVVEAAPRQAQGRPSRAPLRLVAGDAMRFELDAPPTLATEEADEELEKLRRPITYRDVVLADRPLLYWSFDETSGPADEQAHGLARYRLIPVGEATRTDHAALGSGLALGRAADLRSVGVFEGRIQHAGPPSAWALELWLAHHGDDEGYSSQYVLHTNPGTRAGRGFPSNNPSLIFDYPLSADNEVALHSSTQVGKEAVPSRTAGGPMLGDRGWHHLFVVFYGDGVRGVEDRVELYWDGRPVDGFRRQRFSANFRVDTLLVGATRSEGKNQFRGLVDELAIYDFGGLSSQAIERRAAAMVRRHRHAARAENQQLGER